MSRRNRSPTNDAIFHITTARDKAGLDVKYIDSFKGRGVFAVSDFAKGEFVLEYRGELINSEESRRRQRVYHKALKGFMFDFLWHGKFWTIDAARDDGTLGRLVNDDHVNPNCKIKRMIVEGRPRLCLFALRDITSGEEIAYNYGDGDCPWRNKVTEIGTAADSNRLEIDCVPGDHQHCTRRSQQESTFCNTVTEIGTAAESNRLETDCVPGNHQHCTRRSQQESTFCNTVTEIGTAAESNHLETDCVSGDHQHCTRRSQQESTFCNTVTEIGTAAESNHLETDCVPGDHQHCTRRSQQESTFCNTVTENGTPADSNHLETDCVSGDHQHCTRRSQQESTFCNTVTENGTAAESNRLETDCVSGDHQHCTRRSQQESTFCNTVTEIGTAAESNRLETDCVPGDHQHCTRRSQQESTFCNTVTEIGTAAESNRLETDCVPGDHQHCTRRSQQESTFCNTVTEIGTAADSNRLETDYVPRDHQHCTRRSQQESTFCNTLNDACSISSMENSDDEYVPGSSESSSDESACSRRISVSERKFKTMKRICPSRSPSCGQSSAVDASESEVVPDSSSSEVVPDQSSSEVVPDQSSSEVVPDQSSSEVVPDQSSSVFVKGISKSASKARVYNKKQYCLFCSKPLSKMGRHLEQVHSNESEVAKALSFPKGSKERKNILEHIRNRGNFAHNAEVLQCGKGVLVPCKKPRKDCDSQSFVHCCNCQGLFAKKFLWRHMKQCKLGKKDNSHPKPGKNRVLSQSAYMGPAPHGTSAGLWKLLSNMNHDRVVLAIKTDLYIRRLGEYFFNRVGSDTGKHEYVRQKMREVGRLLITAREVTPLSKMEDFVDPANFMHVATAVRKASGYDEEKCTFQRPSLALKLGHSLQKIASLVSFQAMMDRDTERADKARSFSDMYAARWGELISSHALRTQREVKWNAPLVLPFTEDVKMLHLYLDQKQEEYFQKLSVDASAKNWALLAKVTLAQTILFNRRREGEVSKMPLTSFVSKNTDDLHEDIALALSELEKKLCHHFSRIEIRGKRGRKVAVLLTPTMKRNMELIKEKREECAIPPENIYMFARPAAQSHLRGSDCLREFATECGAKNPKALSSTKLRKHIATLSNVLNLNNTELDQLADFLGHDVRVHRDYYRLPEGTLQLAKISKILMALETGRLGEFSGKNLDEIHIDPNEAVLVQSSDMSRDLSGTEDESDEDLGAELNLGLSTKQPQETNQHQQQQPPVQQTSEPTSTTLVPKGVKVANKRKWETNEVNAVEKHLNRFIKTCTVPGKKDCEACIKAEPDALKDRDWLAVKFFVKNRITALKRKM